MNQNTNYWVVIPAAGIGTRMRADRPKQYLQIHQKTVIEHTLSVFINMPEIKGIVVSLAEHDGYWPKLPVAQHDKIIEAPGGLERCHSVLNGLSELNDMADDNDWALVHDAARPCLLATDVRHLIKECESNNTGGILALPVRDTMKRSGSQGEIIDTVEREGLWHALTPQMFRLGELREALAKAVNTQELVTDEAQAMERAGQKPLLVEANPANLKITRPADLELATFYLNSEDT